MCLAQGPQRSRRRGSNTQPLGLESSTLPLNHCTPYTKHRKVHVSHPAQLQAAEDEQQPANPLPITAARRGSMLLLLTQPLNLKLNLLPWKLRKTRLVVGGG